VASREHPSSFHYAVAGREYPSSFHYAVAGREMFTYKKLIPNKKGMSFPSPPAGGYAPTRRRGK